MSDSEEAPRPQRFNLIRERDHSQVSGTGVVAQGVYFPPPNDRVAIGWQTDPSSVTVFDSIEDAMDIHGHGGDTVVEWLDDVADEFDGNGRIEL